MRTDEFIKYLLESDGEERFLEKTFQEYGIRVVQESEYKEAGPYLFHRHGSYFSLGGGNMSCLLEWMFRNIKAEAVNSTKNNCREKFKDNLLKLLD